MERGKRTSVYLTEELAARVKASGQSLATLIGAGLDHLERPSTSDKHDPVTAAVQANARILAGQRGKAMSAGTSGDTITDRILSLRDPAAKATHQRSAPALYPCCKHCVHTAGMGQAHEQACLQCSDQPKQRKNNV